MSGFYRRLAGSVSSAVLVLSFTACSARSATPVPSSVEAAFNSFYQFQDTVVRSDPATRIVASKVHERYRALFSRYQTSAALAHVGPEDVALIFRAASADFLYSVSSVSLADMQLDLTELRRRGIARNDDDEKVYSALVESRLFDGARAFAKLHRLASVEAVPDVVENAGRKRPTVLLVTEGGKKLVRRAVDIEHGRLIVVISSPLCHFCQRAIRSIESDAVLRPLIRNHALWIVPPDQSTPFATVATWNRRHPSEQMS